MKKPYLQMVLALLVLAAAARGEGYDPLKLPGSSEIKPQDLVVVDVGRAREIPILVYLPESKEPSPVVLFSHGLGGSRRGGAYLGRQWAGRRYVVVCLQHPGSDEAVWRDVPRVRRLAAMRSAASAENFMQRVRDVPAVLDQLEQWNKSEGHALFGKMDLSRVGMSGHSFGALTTQAVSGQAFSQTGAVFADPRIVAAVAMSPSSPRRGNAQEAFAKVSIPWLLMTGTHDVAIIGETDVASRLAVFPALPPGGKYELVLKDAEHSAFSDRALPNDRNQRNPNHHRVILALSTAFWDAYLRDDTSARDWLNSKGVESVLQDGDRWQRK